MKLPKILLLLAISFLAAVLISGSACAQGKDPGQAPAKKVPAGNPQITVIGKVAFMDAEGGYYIQGEKPREVFTIANQNPEVLGKLLKSGKTVTIEARTRGDLLTIEKIDGQAYQGTKEPVFK